MNFTGKRQRCQKELYKIWYGETTSIALYLLHASDEMSLDGLQDSGLNWLLHCNVWTPAAGAARVDVSDSAIKSASAAGTVTMKDDGAVLKR